MNVCRQRKRSSETRLGESDSCVVNHGCVCNLVVRMTETDFFFSFGRRKKIKYWI